MKLFVCRVEIYMQSATYVRMYEILSEILQGFFPKKVDSNLKISGNLKKNDGPGGVPSIWLIREHIGYD